MNGQQHHQSLATAMAVPPMTLADPDKKTKIDELLSGLFLSTEQVREVERIFRSEMERGLEGKPSSLQMENTFVPELPDGTEDGEFLALDLGGTNSRVLLLELREGQVVRQCVTHFSVPEHLRVGSGQHLFDFLAQCVHEFVVEKELKTRHLPLGFTFSFPMEQRALDCGVLVTWTKSFNCPSAVGRDAVQLLREAISRRGDLLVDVVAVLNDTTGTLVHGAYEDPQAHIGLILATGSNACYVEKIERIGKWKGQRHDGNAIIDIEWGAFGDNGVLDFLKTDFDKEVDRRSIMVHSFTFEKYLSGKYLGELVRVILVRLTLEGLLFSGDTSERLLESGSFTTRYISLIETDNLQGDYQNTTDILEELGVTFGEMDMEVVQHVCRVVSYRAALLVSTCTAGLLKWMDRDEATTIAVDGSMIKFHPRLRPLMELFIGLMAPQHKFQLKLVEDGSGKGAALVAAIAEKIQHRRTQGVV